MNPRPAALPDVILLDLYASAAEPARWSRTLDQLCLQMGACSAIVQAFSVDHGRARIHWRSMDSRTGRIQYPPNSNVADSGNPRMSHRAVVRSLERIAGNKVFIGGDDDLFDPGDEARTRLQQQLAAVGMGRFLGVLQEVSPGVFLTLALHRPIDDRSDFSFAQLGSLAALAPHLGQAFVLTDRLQSTPMHDWQMRAHLDQLRFGMAFCDAHARVHWLNSSAERLLADSPLRLVGERLRGDSPADTAKLMNELARAEATGSNTVRYLRLGQGDKTLHMAVQAAEHPSTMMLTLTCPSRGVDIPTEGLIQLFGLTPTEARLVGALVAGSTLEQYAQQRGVSVGTARDQLKQVQTKTGARRQSELVRLVWSSAAAYLSRDGGPI